MAHQKQMRRDSLQRSESSAVNLLTLGSTSLEPLARLHRPGGEPAIGGSIRFAGSRRAPSRWVCVAADSSPDFVDGLKQLLLERSGWNLPVPTVVMAIAGADREISSLEMGEKAQRVFRRGCSIGARDVGVDPDGRPQLGRRRPRRPHALRVGREGAVRRHRAVAPRRLP